MILIAHNEIKVFVDVEVSENDFVFYRADID